MVMFMLSMLLLTGCGVAVMPALRRTGRLNATVAVRQGEIALELPVELQHLPEPPTLAPSAIQILDRTEIFRQLMQLSLGVPELGYTLPEHEHIVAAAPHRDWQRGDTREVRAAPP